MSRSSRLRCLWAAALMLGPAAGAFAQGALNPNIMAVDRSFSLAYVLSHFYYLEPSDIDAFNLGTDYEDYEKGFLNGVQARASWMSPEGWYARGEWSVESGQPDYTGHTQGGAPANGISKATIQDYDLRFGRGFAAGAGWMLTPYVSLGGRHWRREIGVNTAADFIEVYNHYFLAAGSLVQCAPAEPWVLTGDVSIGKILSPTIDDPPDGLRHAALGSTPLIRAGLEADYRAGAGLHAFAGLDYKYFTYGQSGVYPAPGGLAVMEPISQTQEWRLSAGLRFSY